MNINFIIPFSLALLTFCSQTLAKEYWEYDEEVIAQCNVDVDQILAIAKDVGYTKNGVGSKHNVFSND